jgi:2-aminoadipate transaminase
MSTRPGFARWLGATNTVTAQFLAAGAAPGVINLGGGLPDPSFHPLAEVQAAVARAFERLGTDLLDYGPVRGLPALRRAIADRVALAGRPVDPANVLIMTGAMQALDLVGKILVDPGDVIAAQTPTYLGALDAWRPREPRYRLLDVPGGEAASAAALRGAKFL